MTDDVSLYLMLVAALAIGFLLGRRELGRGSRVASRQGDGAHLSLHQLVDEQRQLDIDTFVETMVNRDDGVDMRLALGSLVRRRGEVDRAIRVHQSLLARPALTPDQRSRTELELARDYMAAGLLGRAENLLLDLARRNSGERPAAQRALLEIYQREREWRRAVDVGREIARGDRGVRTQLAHFQCELALRAMEQGDLPRARQELARAGDFDSSCARVSLTAAQVEVAAGRFKDARKLLERAVNQDPDCVPLAVDVYREACLGQEDDAGFLAFLEKCLKLGPHLPVVEALADHLERTEGSVTACEFVTEQLVHSPTLTGFVALLDRLVRDGRPLDAEHLALVRQFSRSLMHRQPDYRCHNCGFPSRSLMWQCPSCHEWGSCRPIVATEPAG